MREESHLEDMRAAIRGDLERLTERHGARALPRPPARPGLRLGGGGTSSEAEDVPPAPSRWRLARLLGR